jgi:hypothetical protein
VSGMKEEIFNERVIAIAFIVMNEVTGEDGSKKRVTIAYCIEKTYVL